MHKIGGLDLHEIDKIKILAKEQGKSMSYICNQLGLARSFFIDVSKGKSTLKDDRLAQIAEILGTTPEYLKGETDIKEKLAPESGLSEKENKLLSAFRTLTDEEQDLFLKMFSASWK